MEKIKEIIKASISTKESVLADEDLIRDIQKSADIITAALKADKKVLFCGNGGSAADAQHLAAELSGRFYQDRDPLFAEALHVNSSYITAVANDYGYDQVYSRLVKAKARSGDVLIGLSTSGNSGNIISALEMAKELDVHTISFTGETGGKMKAHSDILLNVPSTDTPRIQEVHIMIGHIICELVENTYFNFNEA